MGIPLPAATTIIVVIKVMMSWVFQFGLIFSFEFALSHNRPRFMHRPVLSWKLIFVIVIAAICCSSIGIKIVSVRMHIVPFC